MPLNPFELMGRAAELMPMAREAVKAVDELIAAVDNLERLERNFADQRESDIRAAHEIVVTANARVKEIRAKLPKDI